MGNFRKKISEEAMISRGDFGSGGKEARRRLLQRMFAVASWAATIPFIIMYLWLFLQYPDYRMGIVLVTVAMAVTGIYYLTYSLKSSLDSFRMLAALLIMQTMPLTGSLLIKGTLLANIFAMLCILLSSTLGLSIRQIIGLGVYIGISIILALTNTHIELLSSL